MLVNATFYGMPAQTHMRHSGGRIMIRAHSTATGQEHLVIIELTMNSFV